MITDPIRIQRIEKPRPNMNPKAIELSFGGGGSGLSEQAQEALNQIMSFDYMGQAEYEFGAVADCLHRMQEDKTNKLMSFKLKNHTIHMIVCPKDYQEYVGFVQGLNKTYTSAQVRESLQVPDKTGPGRIVLGDRIVAWLDIQNDVFFSTDETMTKALAELLGVT